MSAKDVLITGIGLLSSLGEGNDVHWKAFSEGVPPVTDSATFAPYTVHPLPADIDWSTQIPRKEARQMEQWQRIGTYVAGLALADAGIKDDEALSHSVDMIVAAAGGERDAAVDTLILDGARTHNNRERLLNEKLTTELRPTLFLAQLSNLLAGNISIVHKITGSSRTFMGEEGSGISALQTGLARIRSGQSNLLLVGAALNAEHQDSILNYELAGLLKQDGWAPLWQRDGSAGGGVISGSGGAFIVLESREHAERRGATPYARLAAVSGNQISRKGENLAHSIGLVLDDVSQDGADILVSGASGAHEATLTEKATLAGRPGTPPVRAFSGLTGHLKEAQAPFAVALAALAVKHNKPIAPLDPGFEAETTAAIRSALVLTVGQTRGEGAALVTGA